MKLDKDLIEYLKPENLFNRELSWLKFNERVLEEAINPKNPLLERIKFLSIYFSNLDEFYMIRISGIKEQIAANIQEPTIDGLTPSQELKLLENEISISFEKANKLWKNQLLPSLEQERVIFCKPEELDDIEQNKLNNYYLNEIFPVLTPLAFDPGRPFPYISNLSLSFAVIVKKKSGETHFARIKVPGILPRLINLSDIFGGFSESNFRFIWLEDLIKFNLSSLFPGYKVVESYYFRITRDTDIAIQEDEADDLLFVIEENIRQRRFGQVIRVEIEEKTPHYVLDTLIENLNLNNNDIIKVECNIGLSSLMNLYSLPLHYLKDKPFYPVNHKLFDSEESIFNKIKKRDILLHHPYDSFNPVIDFIKEAANDPDVLAIKQTLYRVGKDSPILRHLIKAAENKKQVAVLVELKARFDEENNIYWARELEKAGVHVVYGLLGLKTHAKMTLVIRKESDGVNKYAHLSTGNYNASTAKIYTDLGLFTNDKDITSDMTEIFNFLTGYSEQSEYRKLIVSPFSTRNKIIDRIENEINNVKSGKKGEIIFKFNSLVDPKIIGTLYKASENGVKITLIIRGICCLKPQVHGLSDNIRVISIVGRFLEHSRIYYFYNNNKNDIFLSSADLMTRNLDRRVEVTFPIEDEKIKKIIIEHILEIAVSDNSNARILLPTGDYVFNHKVLVEDEISLQEYLISFVEREKYHITKNL